VKHLIVGGAGQDGTLLSAQLLSQGQQVYSISLTKGPLIGVNYILEDINNCKNIEKRIEEIKPDRVYYFAAYHKSSENKNSNTLDIDIILNTDTNALSFAHLLECLTKYAPHSKTVYASSCRIFGTNIKELITEATPLNPECPYSLSKTVGMYIAKQYRKQKQLFVTNAILFNHESELRTSSFISKKIVLGALNARKNLKTKLEINNLAAKADWGHARDYVRGMKMMLDLNEPDDFILGSGKLHTVEEFVAEAFNSIGLDWKEFVVNKNLTDKNWNLYGTSKKLEEKTTWKPNYTFQSMIEDIIHRTTFNELRPAQFQFYL